MDGQKDPPAAAIVLAPSFKLILLAILFLTVLSLVISVFLSFQKELSEQGKNLFETCSTTWKMGFGAMVGLIGGKVTT